MCHAVVIYVKLIFVMSRAKNYQNRLMFHGVIQKYKSWPHFSWATLYVRKIKTVTLFF